MIKWKLVELMQRYEISGRALAERLEISQNAMSSLRNAKAMPMIGSDRLSRIIIELRSISGQQIELNEIIEFEEDD